MRITPRKSAAIAIAVVGIAGLSLASAAQLNLTSGALGAGSQVVAACDTDGIDVKFVPSFQAGSYNATTVNLTGVAAGCANQSFRIQLTGTAGSLGAELTGTVTGTTITGAITGVAAKDVTGVSVVIYS